MSPLKFSKELILFLKISASKEDVAFWWDIPYHEKNPSQKNSHPQKSPGFHKYPNDLGKISGIKIPRFPKISNPQILEHPQIPGIKNPRFSKIPNRRDKKPQILNKPQSLGKNSRILKNPISQE